MSPVLKPLFIPVVFLLLIYIGCGKKGPPFLPEVAPPPRVEDLKAMVGDDGTIHLSGQVSDAKGEAADVTGCVVYHAGYPQSAPPCKGCPLNWEARQTIHGEVVSNSLLNCEVERLDGPGIHFIRVRLLGDDGVEGPPSAVLRLDSSK